MEFTITKKITPYVRMTNKGKWVDERAKQYLASQEAIAWQFKEQCTTMLPERRPIRVAIEIQTPTPYTGDLDNLVKALLDSAQGIVFKNDCWVSEIYARRERAKEYKAKVIIEVIEGVSQ